MTDEASLLQQTLTFNGINGATGGYLLDPLTPKEIAMIARGESFEKEHLRELRHRYLRAAQTHLGVKEGVDPKKIQETGWGVIFAFDDRERLPALKEVLSELLNLRQEQAGDLYKEYIGVDAYRPEETKTAFLARHGMGPGPADPDKVPYYLMIVGDPETIPYRFQYQLDVQYAVGRIYFDSLEEYAQYARSVVEMERSQKRLPRQAVFFAVQNSDDPATQMSAKHLVQPLALEIAEDQKQNQWQVNSFLAEQATKATLGDLLGGEQTPALLFTASHGMGFPNGNELQLRHQGALLCQDWPGPVAWRQSISEDHYFSADDLSTDARLLGLIAFHFACYGAGTPRLDDFAHQAFREPVAIAPHAFIAPLTQKLLSHPKGGALAAIGHVERAWGYSFMWEKAGAQREVFRSSLKRLMEGHPVGSAVEYFNERYAELSTVLSSELEEIEFGKTPDELALAGMWTSNNDARSYVIVGDPAVRLPVSDDGHRNDSAETERPTISTIVIHSEATVEAPLQPPPAQPDTSGEVISPAALDYGLTDSLRQARDRLTQSVSQFADKLGKTLEKAVDDAATLEVYTYVSDDMSQVSRDFASSAQLRAFTRIRVDGDTEVCIPERSREIDQQLWAIHLDMVQQAQTNRAEMIKAAASAATRLLEALKIV